MFNIDIKAEGRIDFDGAEVEVECPRCQFYNPVLLKQARLRDIVICRGCKSNIQLDDCMNSVRKARESVRRAIAKFSEEIPRLGNR